MGWSSRWQWKISRIPSSWWFKQPAFQRRDFPINPVIHRWTPRHCPATPEVPELLITRCLGPSWMPRGKPGGRLNDCGAGEIRWYSNNGFSEMVDYSWYSNNGWYNKLYTIVLYWDTVILGQFCQDQPNGCDETQEWDHGLSGPCLVNAWFCWENVREETFPPWSMFIHFQGFPM